METPANNADFGAADGNDRTAIEDKLIQQILFFSHGPEGDRLPPIGDQNWIGRLADVAFWSGYFNGTPAQLAIRILAGDAAGLRPAQSLFDLAINGEGSIAWRQAGNFTQTADAIETKTAADNAAAGVGIERNAGSGVEGLRDEFGSGSPAGIVVGYDFKAAAAAEANKGPLTSTADETAQPGLDPGNVGPGPVSVEGRDESASIPGNETVDEEFDRVTRPDPPAAGDDIESQIERDFPGLGIPSEPASPFESKAVDTSAAAGLDVQATLDYWKQTIEVRLRDLGFDDAKVSNKLNEFAEKSSAAKKAMFEQCEQMHAERLKAVRDRVLLALEKDGKGTAESRQGFFFYAEVPDDVDAWTYREASRAWATLEKDFPELAKAVA